MERKLASMQRITHITPIYVNGVPAERIEQAWVLGYRSIVQKGQFKENELVVFIEEDSILPSDANWVRIYAPFMEQYKWKVKLMKLNKMQTQKPNKAPMSMFSVDEWLPTISQGIIMPYVALLAATDSSAYPNEGDDVTQLMGITKYEPPVRFSMGETAGTFPIWIGKTDELRVQSYPHMLEELNGDAAYATLKIDGSSATVWFDADGTAHIASRNLERRDGDNVYWNALRPYLPNMMSVGDRYAFQGEVYGESIQKNPLGIKGVDFQCFCAFDRHQMEYLNYEDEINLCAALGLPHVQVIYEWQDFNESLSGLERLSRGVYPNTSNPREGIVVRPKRFRFSPTASGRLSFKYINPDFLLTQE